MSTRPRKAAVTGVAGFIGSHVADWLLSAGLEVCGIDDLSGGYEENVPAGCAFEAIDVRDETAVDRWLAAAGADLVYHLAADATEGRSQFTPISATTRNYGGYINVLTSAIRHGVEKMVFVSSMSVYGDQDPPFTEFMRPRPVDIYGLAKAASEQATEILADVHGLRYTIIRPHNVYGPRQNLSDPYRNVIAIFLTRALAGEPVYIYGDGEQRRSFSYIDDCAPALARAGVMDETDGESVNVGAATHHSINQLVDAVELALGSPVKREYVADRPREVKYAWCDHTKAEQLFGRRPEVPLEQGLKAMIDWIREVGARPKRYLDQLEIPSDKAPVTWTKKLI